MRIFFYPTEYMMIKNEVVYKFIDSLWISKFVKVKR